MESTSNLWELIRLRTPTPKSKPSNMGGTSSSQKNVQLPKKSKQQKQLYALGIQSRENGNGINFYSLITHPRNCVNLPAVKLHVLFHKKYIPPVHTHTHMARVELYASTSWEAAKEHVSQMKDRPEFPKRWGTRRKPSNLSVTRVWSYGNIWL